MNSKQVSREYLETVKSLPAGFDPVFNNNNNNAKMVEVENS